MADNFRSLLKKENGVKIVVIRDGTHASVMFLVIALLTSFVAFLIGVPLLFAVFLAFLSLVFVMIFSKLYPFDLRVCRDARKFFIVKSDAIGMKSTKIISRPSLIARPALILLAKEYQLYIRYSDSKKSVEEPLTPYEQFMRMRTFYSIEEVKAIASFLGIKYQLAEKDFLKQLTSI